MDKVAMYKEEIYKTAKSFDARRKKQYWQLLKRIHGGTENAIKRLKASRDFGIYHGTRGNIDDILATSLKSSQRGSGGGLFGKGVYFGDKGLAKTYAAKNSLLRLRKPSELESTKLLYPKITSAMNHETRINPKLADKVLTKSQAYGPGYFDGQLTPEQIKSRFKMNNKVWKDNKMKTLNDYMTKPFTHRVYQGMSGQMMYRKDIPGSLLKKVEK